MGDATVEIWILVLRARVLRWFMAHVNVQLAQHSRAGVSDWEEIDGPKRLSVLESAPLSIA